MVRAVFRQSIEAPARVVALSADPLSLDMSTATKHGHHRVRILCLCEQITILDRDFSTIARSGGRWDLRSSLPSSAGCEGPSARSSHDPHGPILQGVVGEGRHHNFSGPGLPAFFATR